MIEERLYYRAICDGCGMLIGPFVSREFPGPQDVTRELLERHHWTAFEEIHHCFRCPPICASCGRDDIECDCYGAPPISGPCRPGIDCDFANDYCRRCDQPEIQENRRGEG